MGSEYSFHLTQRAVKDLDGILDYMTHALSNPVAAKTFYDALQETLARTTAFPESGAPINNPSVTVQGVRKQFVRNYTVYYLLEADSRTITVLRIIYSRRNLDEIIRNIE